MDKETDELEVLDMVGVIVMAFKILRSAARLLWTITLTLMLPLSLLILARNFILDLLFIKDLPERMQRYSVCRNLGELFLLEAAYLSLILAFLLPSMAAVVYTVACVYTDKELRYGKVIRVLPRVSMRLFLTLFWYCLFVLADYVAGLVVLLGWIFIVGLDSGAFLFGVVVATVCIGVHVYATLVWQVASVACVVEERYGLGAMKKGDELLRGQEGTGLALNVVFLLGINLIGWCFDKGVVEGDLHGLGMEERTDNAVILFLLHSALILITCLSHIVFYFVCKSFHYESVSKLVLLDHLEVCFEGHVPLKSQLKHF
ncbi:hypothetical protein SUGI_0935600 [Cryptomeria japonica]|uniref:uncharacterized protein LOC131037936 n=1 Tax=Cryptomeria japonica TaxID=3369 RepID=UPI002414725A|nr:uncharacterized protein LOC131037936 [Cryptomeria japonica]GLJ44550.1 hypothetical protein SUGI_0935600 [Cryptomeria japonica]